MELDEMVFDLECRCGATFDLSGDDWVALLTRHLESVGH